MIKGHASFPDPYTTQGTHHFIYQRKLKAFKKLICKHLSYFACNVFLTCVEVNWQTEPRNKGKTEFIGCGREKVQGLLGVVNLLGKFGGGGKLISWQLPKRSILEWSIRGVKENSSVIDRFSRTFEFSCGMRVLNRLSLSLHLPSAPPPQSDHVCTLPSLEFLTEQSCNSLAPCGSQP